MSKIVQELLSLGYTEHKGNRVHHKDASRWFQKRVRGEYGTKYFINVALYDYSMLNPFGQVPEHLLEDLQPEYDVQFTKEGNVCNVSYFAPSTELVEEFCEKMFTTMEFDPYD